MYVFSLAQASSFWQWDNIMLGPLLLAHLHTKVAPMWIPYFDFRRSQGGGLNTQQALEHGAFLVPMNSRDSLKTE